MIDFLIDFFVEIADFFIDLWVNKITAKKRKNDKGSEENEQK